jgi:hypothetical protein
MSNVPFDAPPSLWRKTDKDTVEMDGVTDGAGVSLGLDNEEQVFELPAAVRKTAVCGVCL